MSEYSKNLVALLVRSFIPINSFYFNYLVDSKNLSNHEVSDRVAPFYFYFSFLGLFLCKTILHSLGIAISSAVISFVLFLNMIILLNIPKRGLFWCQLVYSISGFATSCDLILRFYIAETNTKSEGADTRYSLLNALRAIAISVSCFTGHQIAMRTGHHEINIHISILTQLGSFCISLFTAIESDNNDNFVEINSLKSVLDMDSMMLRAFLTSVTGSSFNFFIRFFSQSIFRDSKMVLPKENSQNDSNFKDIKSEVKSKVPNNTENQLGNDIDHGNFLLSNYENLKFYILFLIKLPIIVISEFFIFIYTTILPKYKEVGTVQKDFLYGNTEAFIGLCCYLSSYFIVKVTEVESKEYLYSILLILASICLFTMTQIKNRKILCLMYLTACICATSSNQVSKGFLKKTKNDNNLIVACFITEIVIHNIINQICTMSKLNSIIKSKIYSYFGLLVSLGVLSAKIIKDN